MDFLVKIFPNYIGWGEVPVLKSLDVGDVRVALITCKSRWTVQLLRSVKGDKKLWSIVNNTHHRDHVEAEQQYHELAEGVLICSHVRQTSLI